MDAIRCLDCGDVRWSLMGLRGRSSPCVMCGGETVPERRRPATGTVDREERRDLMVPSRSAPDPYRPTA
jgi:hypothetical protein